MPKLGMEPKRRADVINATLTCISYYGINGWTLDQVAKYANCSKGVVTYYFKTKDHLIIEALRSFMAYFGMKIQSELEDGMSASDMIQVTLKHILPLHSEDQGEKINVSQLDGTDAMFVPFEEKARLFVQFFSRAATDQRLQEAITASYKADLQGIAKIFAYGNQTGEMKVQNPEDAAYGLFAMVVGLSFLRVANVPTADGKDNRYICEEYIRTVTR